MQGHTTCSPRAATSNRVNQHKTSLGALCSSFVRLLLCRRRGALAIPKVGAGASSYGLKQVNSAL